MTIIIKHLVDMCNQSPEMATQIAEPFEKHDDIRAELEQWIERQEYPQDNPLTVEGYTAESISKLAPFMNGVGAYNFLVTLREHPSTAKQIIAEGFPIM